MTQKTPIRTVFDESNNATGLAEFQSGEFIGLTHGGLGASLSIGSAGQVLKVNSGGTAVEFGNVDDVLNIDGATDLTGVTLATTDQLLVSDGGTEGRVTLAQLDTLFISTTQTLTNKTISGSSNTLSNIGNSSLTNSSITFAGDSGSDSASLGETLTVAGGTGIDTTGTSNTITVAIDSTVATLTGSQTLTNKTITSPTVSGLALSDSSIVFEGSTDDTNETTLTATDPTADRTITLPNASGGIPVFATAPTSAITDGTDGQALVTDGSGVLSFATIAANFPQSTLVVAPGSEGNFDLAFDPTQSTQETPFESVGSDAFGIATSSVVFSAMDPTGDVDTVDLGAFS